MSTSPAVLPDRLKELDELTVDHGGHGSFQEGHCAMELVSYLAGEPHSAAPSCTSPVLTRFMVRLNDSLPAEARQQLKPYLPKVIGTAGDGKDQVRGWMATDWLIRIALPTWLDLADADEAAAKLRELPEITAETIDSTRPLVQRIRGEAFKLRTSAREALRDKVYKAVKEKLGENKAAYADAAYAAAAAAYAAAAAAYAAAADAAYADAADAAAAAAYAYAAAAYAAAAYAAYADAAYADAAYADAAYADAAARRSVRAAVRKAVRERVEEVLEPKKVALLPSALELLDKMIDPEVAG
jgi:chemotaxis protein histidine kinase CheA